MVENSSVRLSSSQITSTTALVNKVSATAWLRRNTLFRIPTNHDRSLIPVSVWRQHPSSKAEIAGASDIPLVTTTMSNREQSKR